MGVAKFLRLWGLWAGVGGREQLSPLITASPKATWNSLLGPPDDKPLGHLWALQTGTLTRWVWALSCSFVRVWVAGCCDMRCTWIRAENWWGRLLGPDPTTSPS